MNKIMIQHIKNIVMIIVNRIIYHDNNNRMVINVNNNVRMRQHRDESRR